MGNILSCLHCRECKPFELAMGSTSTTRIAPIPVARSKNPYKKRRRRKWDIGEQFFGSQKSTLSHLPPFFMHRDILGNKFRILASVKQSQKQIVHAASYDRERSASSRVDLRKETLSRSFSFTLERARLIIRAEGSTTVTKPSWLVLRSSARKEPGPSPTRRTFFAWVTRFRNAHLMACNLEPNRIRSR